MASSASPDAVVDTVVLRYFLLVDEVDLLLTRFGGSIAVPRVVFDPDEGDIPETARSEVTRSIHYQRRVAQDPARDAERRQLATRNAERLTRVSALHSHGRVQTIDLSDTERLTLGQLTSPSGCKAFGLVFPLDPGEAACVAVAVARGLTLATDDGDALKALRTIAAEHPYDRIRKLLIRAARSGLISSERANAIHREMRSLGFWDSQPPFR